MKLIRKLILALFGLEGYLKLVSKVYLLLVRNGFLKSGYPELFHLEQIVKPGYVCIDIGANVGYYSDRMLQLIGDSGQLHAVEPIPLFANVWKSNVRNSERATLHNAALGAQEMTVEMGIPMRDGMIRHGMTKITSTVDEDYYKKFDVKMKVPDRLFIDLQKLDFVKCDVEGFESVVFSNMKEVLAKFKPLVQSELSGTKNRQQVIEIFQDLGYAVNLLDHETLKFKAASTLEMETAAQDFYFIPKDEAAAE